MNNFLVGLLVVGIASIRFANAQGLASFQLSTPVADQAQLFFVDDDERVFRFSTRLSLEDVRSSTQDSRAPISTIELATNASGKILKFAVFRFSDAEVYEIRHEDGRLKFVKMEGSSALFTGSMSSYRAAHISSAEAFEFMKVDSKNEPQNDNIRILRLIRLIEGEENLASRMETAKPEVNKQEFLNLLDQDVEEMNPKPAEELAPKPLVGEAPSLN